AGVKTDNFDWQNMYEALNNKYAAKMELQNLEYLQQAVEKQAKLEEMAQGYAGLDSGAKITLAEENLDKAKKDYKTASQGWGAAAMRTKGGSTAARLREKAGLSADEFDWQSMDEARENKKLNEELVNQFKSEQWWEEANTDQARLEAEAKNSAQYQQQLQEAPTTRYNYTLRNGFSPGQSKYITDDEVAIYETLKLTDPQGAERYWEILEYELNARSAEAQAQGLKDASGLANLGAYLGSAVAAPLGVLNTGYEALRQWITGEYRPVDINADAYIGARVSNQAQQNLTGDIEEPFIQFLAQTGLSMASYAAKLPFGPTGALVALSTEAANTIAYDTLQRCGSAADAFWNGLLSGTIEAMTEKLPLDRLFKMARGGTKLLSKAGIKNVLSQAGIEGSEEVVSSYLQTLTDIALMGDNSQYELTVQSYIDQGMNEAEARRQASIDIFITEPFVYSFFGGAISGGVFGAGATAISGIKRNNQPLDAQTTEQYNEIEDNKSAGLDGKLNGGIDNGRVDDRRLGREDIYRGESGGEIYQGMRGTERLGAERQQAAGRSGEISGEDSEGRRIDPARAGQVEGTAVLDGQNRPIRLYHWTPNMEFSKFGEGDIGFHFGTQQQANERKKQDQYGNEGITIQAYLNIKNPLQLDDKMNWQPNGVALQLWFEKGLLTEAEYERINQMVVEERSGGDNISAYNAPSAVILRELLADKGYDGIAYPNAFEG
ncbi:MAG: hypothetical protein HP052_02405, partial [Firmicutes bacterium]|nr:hypothetical protein [Bacillota bacterium]